MPDSRHAVSVLLISVALAAIAAGSFARLYDFDRMVVWHDEVFSLLRIFGFDQSQAHSEVFTGRDLRAQDLLAYQRPAPELGFGHTWSSLMTHPEHSPLFYLAAWAAAPQFHSPLAGVRGTSAVLSLLLVPAMFWLAWELFKDSATAWVAAALTAVSPLHLLYAQEARQYALWTVCTAAASAALLRALRKRRARDWALYGVMMTLGLYTHLLFALVLAAHGAYMLLLYFRERSQARTLMRGWGLTVVAAALAFSPWIAVVVANLDRVQKVTTWMEHPVSIQRLLEAWGVNLVRVFADLPVPHTFVLIAFFPLAWFLWRFCVDAPHSSRLFTCLLFLAFVTVVLVPDLVQGGKRSLHPRYVLPGFLAVELAVAYVLGTGWRARSNAERVSARSGFFIVLGLGLWSGWLILQAGTWWTKNFSAENREVAALINAAERPLLIVSDSSEGLGEAISLSYDLKDKAVIRGEPLREKTVPVIGFSDIFLLAPSAGVRAQLSTDYDLVPVLGTWQWYRAVPKSKGKGT